MGLGYFVDLSAITLSDDSKSCWIMACPFGTYSHPEYGKLVFDKDKLDQLADSVNNNVRTTELDIDYDHKLNTTEAAGWVKSAEVRDNGLWILVEWTQKAFDLIKSKAYKYFSPEFVDEWKHPKTGETFKNVLCGGGITNRPYLKDIAPINLNEFVEGLTMDEAQFKALIELLGLAEDATVEDVFAKIKQITSDKQEDTNRQDNANGQPPAKNDENQQYSELLKSDNPVIKSVIETLNAQGTQLSEMTKKLHDAEVTNSINALIKKLHENKKTLSPVAEDAIRQTLNSTSTNSIDSVIALAEKLISGVVSLGESGSKDKTDFDQDDVKVFNDAIEGYMKANEVDYATAVIRVSSDNPQLAENYRNALK